MIITLNRFCLKNLLLYSDLRGSDLRRWNRCESLKKYFSNPECRTEVQISHGGTIEKDSSDDGDSFLLGVGIGDITGPIVEVEMMGYANVKQIGTGLQMRLRSRAFIVSDLSKENIWVLVNAVRDTAVRRGVVEELEKQYPGVFSQKNVALVGTHSHAGVAGFIQNLLPQITSKGFVKENYEAIVTGTVLAIKRAYENLSRGELSHGTTELLDTNSNRSPSAYDSNPKEETDRYDYNVDKVFDLVKFMSSSDNKPKGFMSWFAVHGTSMFRTLIGSDNKGMAAYLYESTVEPDSFPGNTSFVAGFFQSNVGDTTPNVLGAYCESGPYAGELCSFDKSLCGNRAEPCQGRGPAFPQSDWESTSVIGENQKKAAEKLMSTNLNIIRGSVKSVYTTVDMSSYRFREPGGNLAKTCPPAMGYAFAGGTTDGPGAFDFYQGNNHSKIDQNPLWNLVGSAVGGFPTKEQVNCHNPKPILLNTGFASFPYDWSPKVVDIQIFKVGQLVILIVPGEFTTMSGRRLRESVQKQLAAEGILGEEAVVILTGPANTYTHYVSTEEEYKAQRYEGASTIYGPKTLGAYIDIYTKHVGFLSEKNNSRASPGPGTSDLRTKALSFVSNVKFDGHPTGRPFGEVLIDVNISKAYSPLDLVEVTFQAANPRNDLLLEDSYFYVQTHGKDNVWRNVRSDSHPSTKFEWKNVNHLLSHSEAKVKNTTAGNYRIFYKGHSKSLNSNITPFTGISNTFYIKNSRK
ncbi:Neutral/alkaline nonlysosomal ceramidase [Phakopsora pachyrhizi]|uniref:Neutral ceramidase n=1 Tax=Phakopsora pachyrhizi TaxID=170000 RepID=A0AAV0BNW6_PHAPC|nr:Neutral/alkaline nonlysosomal ceramidase [Phakopsora pachyrhizi]